MEIITFTSNTVYLCVVLCITVSYYLNKRGAVYYTVNTLSDVASKTVTPVYKHPTHNLPQRLKQVDLNPVRLVVLGMVLLAWMEQEKSPDMLSEIGYISWLYLLIFMPYNVMTIYYTKSSKENEVTTIVLGHSLRLLIIDCIPTIILSAGSLP